MSLAQPFASAGHLRPITTHLEGTRCCASGPSTAWGSRSSGRWPHAPRIVLPSAKPLHPPPALTPYNRLPTHHLRSEHGFVQIGTAQHGAPLPSGATRGSRSGADGCLRPPDRSRRPPSHHHWPAWRREDPVRAGDRPPPPDSLRGRGRLREPRPPQQFAPRPVDDGGNGEPFPPSSNPGRTTPCFASCAIETCFSSWITSNTC